MWAKNRLSAAAAMAIQINPSTRAAIGRVKGMQIGVGFPLFKQQLYLPSPFIGPANRVERVALGRQVGQQVAEAPSSGGSS